jgi:hypothetical protein
LELTALLVGAATAAQHTRQPHHTLLMGSDNTAACSWLNKGSTTSTMAPAYLLHQLARLRRALKFNLSAIYVPGISNQITYCCSRFSIYPTWTL